MTEVRLPREAFNLIYREVYGVSPNVRVFCATLQGSTEPTRFILEEEKPKSRNPFGGPFADLGDILSPLQETGSEYREKCKTCGGHGKVTPCDMDHLFSTGYGRPVFKDGIPVVTPCPDCKKEEPATFEGDHKDCAFTNADKIGFINGTKSVVNSIDLANIRLESAENHIKALQDAFNKACEAGDKDIKQLQDALACTNVELRSWIGKYEGHRTTTNQRLRILSEDTANLANIARDHETDLEALDSIRKQAYDIAEFKEKLSRLESEVAGMLKR